MLLFKNFYSLKNCEKSCTTVPTKILSSISTFLKDHVTLKTSFAITGINYILKYIKIGKRFFENAIIFHDITVITVFFDQINASLVNITEQNMIYTKSFE